MGTRGICNICRRPDADEIDHDLSGGHWTLSDISNKYGIPRSSVHYHKQKHMTARLRKAASERAKGSDPDLLTQIEERLQKCITYCEHAISGANTDRNWTAFVGAVRELRSTVVEIGRFRGLIKGGDTTINVLQLDEAAAERVARAYLARREPLALPASVVQEGSAQALPPVTPPVTTPSTEDE